MVVGQLIRVELVDGATCRMAKKAFDLFLNLGKIARFERSDGWVTVETEPLRDSTNQRTYKGPERRLRF